MSTQFHQQTNHIVLKGRLCADCGAPTLTRNSKYCPTHGPLRAYAGLRKPKPSSFPAHVIEEVKRIYQEQSARGSLKKYAQRVGIKYSAVKRLAQTLGLIRPKAKPWSEAELTIIRESKHRNIYAIMRRLANAGFKRSYSAIHKHVQAADHWREEYSATEMAACFGVQPRTLITWITLGYLKARGNGHKYFITPKQARNFIQTHPMQFDIRKVDQLWFMDMVFNGRLGDYMKGHRDDGE